MWCRTVFGTMLYNCIYQERIQETGSNINVQGTLIAGVVHRQGQKHVVAQAVEQRGTSQGGVNG
jgi:hypothetical protein